VGTPTQSWANRYDSRFDLAHRFLHKSVRMRRLVRAVVFGNVALLLVGAIAIAALMAAGRAQAQRAEAAALEARNNSASLSQRLEEANRLFQQAVDSLKEGKSSQAEALVKQAEQVQSAKAAPVMTPSELTELDRLRRQETAWRQTEADLRTQLAGAKAPVPVAEVTPVPKSDLTATERAELDRLRTAESTWERDAAQIKQQLAGANERLTKSQQAESLARKSNEELQARLEKRDGTPPVRAPDTAGIEQLLREYEAAYGRRDAEAVVRLMPSAKTADLASSFSQVRSYQMEILNPLITVTGDTAVVTGTRRVSIEPRVGSRPPARLIPSVFRMKRTEGVWTIESVEEKR
jgi:ketosteroid isomerase-like protein